jgi:Acetyl-CoA carboxylase alpha subunit
MAAMLRRALADSLRQFQGMSINDLRQRRFERLDVVRQVQGNDAGCLSPRAFSFVLQRLTR